MSLALLLEAQLDAVVAAGGEAIGISAPGPFVAAIEQRGVRHIPLRASTRGWNLRSDLRAALELWQILRRERPTVLHTHNPKPGLYGRVIGRLAGVPIVVNTVHGLYATPADPLLRRVLVYSLEAFASRWSDVELVQNIEDVELMRRRRLVGRTQAAAPRQRRRPAGASTPTAAPATVPSCGRRGASTSGPWSSARSVDSSPRRATSSCSRRSPISAPTSASSSSAGPIRTGPTPSTRPCCSARRRAGVVLLGHRDDVDRLLGGFDLFVLASHREGQPRAAMEAAASGLPIVATDVRGCRQVVDDGTTGLLVPVADVGALRAAIRDARRVAGAAAGDGRGRAGQGRARVRRARGRAPGDGRLHVGGRAARHQARREVPHPLDGRREPVLERDRHDVGEQRTQASAVGLRVAARRRPSTVGAHVRAGDRRPPRGGR